MKRTKALESTAYHEAGHTVAAWRHRIAIRNASIVSEGRPALMSAMGHKQTLMAVVSDVRFRG